MKITAEEQLMYNVMKAIYESGIPTLGQPVNKWKNPFSKHSEEAVSI